MQLLYFVGSTQLCYNVMYRRDDNGADARGKRYRDGRGALSDLAAASAVVVAAVVAVAFGSSSRSSRRS